jgi:hypothetical protein
MSAARNLPAPTGRVRFIEYQGKQVLFLDLTDCTPEDVFEAMDECQQIVTAQPPHSVLTLSDYTGGQFTREAVRRMKEVAAYDRPHVKRAAVVGLESMPVALFRGIMDFSARRFPSFKTREDALDWLVQGK